MSPAGNIATQLPGDEVLRWNWNPGFLMSPHNPSVIYFGAIDTEHARRSLNDPLMQRAIRRVPKSFLTYSPAAGAAEAIERAIQRRARTAVYPRSNAPLMHLPGVAKRAMERWFYP